MTDELILPDAAAWHDWLTENHRTSDGVWLVLAKKDVTTPTNLVVADALDEALCHGWIDGQRKTRDAHTYLQRYTPRRARSTWSQRNVDYIARLDQAGRMQPAGWAEVDRAKADGRWANAYSGSANLEIPADLAAAIAANPQAQAMFDILTSANRFAVVYQVNAAKREETRTRRITKFVTDLADGKTVYPQKRSR